MSSNVKQCLCKVAHGHFTMVVTVLGSSGVAPYSAHTIKALEAKHPYKPPPSMPSTLFSEAPLVVEVDIVFKCIKSFFKGTSYGRDGLRAQNLLNAMCGEGYFVSKDLLCSITLVVNLRLRGSCRMSLAELISSTPLTLLLKCDGRIQPIDIGFVWSGWYPRLQ